MIEAIKNIARQRYEMVVEEAMGFCCKGSIRTSAALRGSTFEADPAGPAEPVRHLLQVHEHRLGHCGSGPDVSGRVDRE